MNPRRQRVTSARHEWQIELVPQRDMKLNTLPIQALLPV